MDVSIRSEVNAVKDQVSCDLAGESVILNLKNGTYYGLNPMGAWIWNHIQQPSIVEDIQSLLLNEFDVEAERGEKDLLALLNDLAKEGLIEVKDE